MKVVVCIGILLSIIACNSNKKAVGESVQDISKVEVTPDDIVFMLKKTPCFGTCPTYTMRIYNNRYTEFIGTKHTEKIGTFGKFLTENDYKQLVQSFEDKKFISYDDFYESNIADLPSVSISYFTSDSKKTIKGKRERPEAIHKLQFKLETIAESTTGWTATEAKIKEAPKDKIDKTQIVIEVGQANRLGSWLNDMREKFGMHIVKRLSDNNDEWLVSYNTKEHNAEDVLAYLKADTMIKSADFKKFR